MRTCPVCHRGFEPRNARQRFCNKNCSKAYRRVYAGQRYNETHRQERRGWLPVVEGGGVRCARCGQLIVHGQEWHLDHLPGGSRPSHAFCNVSAGQRAGALGPMPPMTAAGQRIRPAGVPARKPPVGVSFA